MRAAPGRPTADPRRRAPAGSRRPAARRTAARPRTDPADRYRLAPPGRAGSPAAGRSRPAPPRRERARRGRRASLARAASCSSPSRICGTHAHHLRQRPVGDALPVGQAAAAVPPDVLREPVQVLEELPGQPRLADSGDPRDLHQLRPALLGGSMKQLFDQSELPLPARRTGPPTLRSEARLHVPRSPAPPGTAVPARPSPSAHARPRPRTPRPLARPARGLADQHRSRLGRGLDPGGGVHEIPGNHSLADRARFTAASPVSTPRGRAAQAPPPRLQAPPPPRPGRVPSVPRAPGRPPAPPESPTPPSPHRR